jgi:hypothetical protein
MTINVHFAFIAPAAKRSPAALRLALSGLLHSPGSPLYFDGKVSGIKRLPRRQTTAELKQAVGAIEDR